MPPKETPSPVPVTPVIPTVVPAPGPVPIPPSSTVLKALSDENIKWERKFDSTRGNWIQERAQWDTDKGKFEAQVRGLTEKNASLQVELTTLKTAQATLTQQVGAIPELQKQAGRVDQLQNQNAKLQAVLKYPQLVNQVAVVETKGDDGKTTKERKNPFVDLVLNSTLTGQAFLGMLEDLAGRLAVSAAPGSTTPGVSPLHMTILPPAPVQATTLEDLKRQANEASLAGDTDLFFRLQDQIGLELAKQ